MTITEHTDTTPNDNLHRILTIIEQFLTNQDHNRHGSILVIERQPDRTIALTFPDVDIPSLR